MELDQLTITKPKKYQHFSPAIQLCKNAIYFLEAPALLNRVTNHEKQPFPLPL
jgi:hypothetical protein